MSLDAGDVGQRHDHPRYPKSNRTWLLITAVAGVIIATMAAHSLGGFEPYPPPMAHAHESWRMGEEAPGQTPAQNNPAQLLLDDAFARHLEESRQVLNTRSMPFWGQVHMTEVRYRLRLRQMNEEVRTEALDWILDQGVTEGVSIKVRGMTALWSTSGNFVRFVVTVYYIEEG